jgi:hypothetical protein
MTIGLSSGKFGSSARAGAGHGLCDNGNGVVSVAEVVRILSGFFLRWPDAGVDPLLPLRFEKSCRPIGIGESLAASPSHTTVHTGPYTAVQ